MWYFYTGPQISNHTLNVKRQENYVDWNATTLACIFSQYTVLRQLHRNPNVFLNTYVFKKTGTTRTSDSRSISRISLNCSRHLLSKLNRIRRSQHISSLPEKESWKLYPLEFKIAWTWIIRSCILWSLLHFVEDRINFELCNSYPSGDCEMVAWY